jgi:hypothetical protein
MQAKARQGEAKVNLSRIYLAEQQFYADHGRYGTLDEIGFGITEERWTRYTYRIDSSGSPGTIVGPTHSLGTSDNSIAPAQLSPKDFVATATGNIDGDGTIDQWHITGRKELKLEHDVDDVRD